MYTKCQKKHHFFRTTLSKIQIIKITHNWAQISYTVEPRYNEVRYNKILL